MQRLRKRVATPIARPRRGIARPRCTNLPIGECHSLPKHSAREHPLSSRLVRAQSVNDPPRQPQTGPTFRSGRLLRCRAQPSAGGGVGGTSSTRVCLAPSAVARKTAAGVQFEALTEASSRPPTGRARRAPHAIAGRASIHARRRCRRAASREQRRRLSRRTAAPRERPRPRGHAQTALDDPRDRGSSSAFI